MAITTDIQARTAKEGKHSAGGGLYLHVTAAGRYWRMKYRFAGKEKLLSFGVYPATTFSQARKARDKARDLLAHGIDPGAAKRQEKAAKTLAAANSFEAVAREFHGLKSSEWSDEHAKRWIQHAEKDLFPCIGREPIANINSPMLLDALRRVEKRGVEDTAHRLRQMAGAVFRYGIQTGRCETDPAQALRDALKPVITKNMPAILEPEKLGRFLRSAWNYGGQPMTNAALRLAPMLFQRPINIRTMEWAWINFDEAMLTIPAMDMKRRKHEKINGRPHLVPLAPQAITVLRELHPLTGSGRYVFPSVRGNGRPMSSNTVNQALRNMGFDKTEATGHGFRSTARTLIAEKLPSIQIDVIERQLAHKTRDPLGEAYDRAQFMEQRKAMMREWADYLDRLRIGAEVLQFPAAKQA